MPVSLIGHSSLLFRRRLKSLLKEPLIFMPWQLSEFKIWNKISQKDEADGKLSLIISLLIES